jgi:hypothetical protein
MSPVRGTVESISGTALTVTTKDGPVAVRLGTPLTVYTRAPSDLAHVTPKTFVGVTSVKQPDGSERATEIHIFPDALRGVGEGSYMMSPAQSAGGTASRMTNGSVAEGASASRMTNGTVNATTGASTISVQYAGGVQTISVPHDVTVTALAQTTAPLTPGESVVVLAKKASDGSLTSTSIIALTAGPTK